MKPGFRNDSSPDERIANLRVPPHNFEAEQAVLGGLMLAPAAIWRVLDILQADTFYRRDHQLIFTAIMGLHEAGQPFDVVTLGEWFDRHGKAAEIGGSAYMIELASTTPSAANITAYAEIVREKAMLRNLIQACAEGANKAFEPGHATAVEVLADVQADMARVLQGQPMELEGPQVEIAAMVAEAAHRDEQPQIRGLTTGLPELDAILGGLRGGQLILIGGRPKSGKSTLAQGIGLHVAMQQRKRVGFHSLEMPKRELLERMTCAIGGIDANRMRLGQMTEGEWSAWSHATGKLNRAPMLFSGPRNVRIEQLIAQTQRAHAQTPLGLVIVDYCQLIDIGRAENESIGFGQVSRQLKLLAGAIDVPVILLSQLNRGLESRNDKRPVPADLRSSGNLEQDADAVVFVYRDEVYHKRSPDRGTAELIVSIQRSGKPGMARVWSDLDKFRFLPLPADWEPPPLPAESTTKPASDEGKRKTGFRPSKRSAPPPSDD